MVYGAVNEKSGELARCYFMENLRAGLAIARGVCYNITR